MNCRLRYSVSDRIIGGKNIIPCKPESYGVLFTLYRCVISSGTCIWFELTFQKGVINWEGGGVS